MAAIVSFSPFRCRMWALHDRLEENINEDTCRAEIESFEKHGQLLPVLGRTIHGQPDYDVELIFGSRRLFAARHLNKPLQVEVRSVTDREAIIAMDIENRQRTDLSPFERGMGLARYLRTDHFRSQDELAHALKLSPSMVSRLLKLSRLPTIIIEAFKDPRQICEGWGADLLAALDDPQRRAATVEAARAVAALTERPPATQIYQKLLEASSKEKAVKTVPREEVVTDKSGHALFRIRGQGDSVVLLLPAKSVSSSMMKKIRAALTLALQPGRQQTTDAGANFPRKRRLRDRAEPNAVERTDDAAALVAAP